MSKERLTKGSMMHFLKVTIVTVECRIHTKGSNQGPENRTAT
ncbi:hypothetical protein [Leptospira santarosai]|nr:hypothetical protein [Leptospira santarosai]